MRTNGSDLVKDGRRNAADWLAGSGRPTAIFCCNDLLAIGALQTANACGLRIPAELAVDRMLAQDGLRQEGARRAVLAPELVLRESTAVWRR
ncbi:hypothetical protein BG53_11210 [Paenibacillus darwinianus]|uniref:Transcriptional regulator LacI/GalR-like sensor domain-containing protein n=2 Tax=Paenibacillus darwinianus TaxID=1380763 RepID=A0A9W5S2J9_9BACL|nr:hypothetical protein BG53_11210 [Paenibacillus darwinianus]EXX92133.1 hypothetical protein CH50_11945 [Paenibacillus darwinianus]